MKLNKLGSKNIGKIILTAAFFCGTMNNVSAQISTQNLNGNGDAVNAITTAVPFLLIGPDSRAGAMGDGGVATSADVNANHWNPSKLAFIDRKYAIGLSYTPWLQKLVPDINLAYLSGYYKLDNKQVFGASLRYFSLGDITFTDNAGNVTGQGNPNEFALDLSYTRKLSERLGVGTAFRFINSDLAQGQLAASGQDIMPGRSVAVDVSTFYQNPDLIVDGKRTTFTFGAMVSNVGAKMNYTNSTDRFFIPTNLKIGVGGKMKLDDYNEISAFVEANKLLVPTPPIYAYDSLNNPIYNLDGTRKIIAGKDPNVSVPTGIMQSFTDAPGGMKEEFREIYYSAGFEYWYDKQFALRAGYFYEHPTKGDRQYFTIGAGIKYNVFGIDLSYLIPTKQQNPLENTLRFSLTFNFEDAKLNEN